MKFLFTVHQFFPECRAGTEVMTLSVARELRARGHEVRLLTGFPAQDDTLDEDRRDTYTYDGFLVYRYHHSRKTSVAQPSVVALAYDNHDAADYFGSILLEYAPDVVHFFHLNHLGTGLIETAKLRGVPAFMSPTDFWSVCPTTTLMRTDTLGCDGPSAFAGNCVQHLVAMALEGRSKMAASVVRKLPVAAFDSLARNSSQEVAHWYPGGAEVVALKKRLACNIERLNALHRVVVPTQFLRTVLLKHGVASERIVCVPYGVAPIVRVDRNYAMRAQFPLRIGFIGTLRSHKGAHVLINAFKMLPAGHAVLALYGNKGDHPEYATQIQRSAQSVGGVVFKGTFPNEEIGAVLAEMDVLVVPSLWQENTPLVVHSALAAGCPVVASRVAGIAAQIEHGKNGYLYEAGSAQDLSALLLKLACNRAELQGLSDNCQPVQTMQNYVSELLNLWQFHAEY